MYTMYSTSVGVRNCQSWGRIEKKHGVWDPMPELTITSSYVHSRVDSNTFTITNPMPESTLSPSKDLASRLESLFLYIPVTASQIEFYSRKLSFHKQTNIIPKITKNIWFLLLSSFIIEQSWNKISICLICWVLHIPFCDAAVAKSTVM